MALDDLEKKLRVAQEHLRKTTDTLGQKYKWEEHRAILDEIRTLEGEIAAKKGEAYAIALDFPVQWSIGAPLPHVISNDYRSFLTFILQESDPDWDGTYITVRSPHDEIAIPLALVEFHGCISTKLGSPNDEILHGHFLSRMC